MPTEAQQKKLTDIKTMFDQRVVRAADMNWLIAALEQSWRQQETDVRVMGEIGAARDKVVKRLERTERQLAVSESKLAEAREVLNDYVRFHNKSFTYSGAQLRDMFLRAQQVLVDVKFVSYKHVEGDAECPCNECRMARFTGCEFCNEDHQGECQSPQALQYHAFNFAQSLTQRAIAPSVFDALEALSMLPHLLREMKRLYGENESLRSSLGTTRNQNFGLRRKERATRRFLDAARAHANRPHDAELLAEEDEAYTALLALLEPESTEA